MSLCLTATVCTHIVLCIRVDARLRSQCSVTTCQTQCPLMWCRSGQCFRLCQCETEVQKQCKSCTWYTTWHLVPIQFAYWLFGCPVRSWARPRSVRSLENADKGAINLLAIPVPFTPLPLPLPRAHYVIASSGYSSILIVNFLSFLLFIAIMSNLMLNSVVNLVIRVALSLVGAILLCRPVVVLNAPSRQPLSRHPVLASDPCRLCLPHWCPK